MAARTALSRRVGRCIYGPAPRRLASRWTSPRWPVSHRKKAVGTCGRHPLAARLRRRI